MQNISLTKHFKFSEFTVSRTAEEQGIENIPPPEAVENLKRLCENTLEPLREDLGLPVIITSGYRCQALNNIIVHSNKRKSQHLYGQAADLYVVLSSGFMIKGLSRRDLLVMAFRLIITDANIDYDQLIIYPTFIHVSYVSRKANRHKLTRAFGNGKYQNLTRAQALSLS